MFNNDIRNDIAMIIRDNKIYRYLSQIQYAENTEQEKIKKILSNLQKNKPEINNPREELDNFIKTIGENQYKKSWNKLRDFQKKDRLINYINSINIDNENKELLLQMLNDKKLKSSKVVDYDVNLSKIVSIKCLKLNNNMYEVEI